jgi:hypothetical protein
LHVILQILFFFPAYYWDFITEAVVYIDMFVASNNYTFRKELPLVIKFKFDVSCYDCGIVTRY